MFSWGCPMGNSVDAKILKKRKKQNEDLEKHNPLVTALICNYNYGRYLGEAIDSALAQTYREVEVLVVDDGSKDDSCAILKNYEDCVRVIYKENGGQASAFNIGIKAARGDIICFLDSDDLWESDKIEWIVAKYQEAPWGLVCHDLKLIDTVGEDKGLSYSKYADCALSSGLLLDELVENGYPWLFSPTSGISMPAEIARRVIPIPETGWRICADTPLVYAAVCHGPVGVISEQLGRYRLHDMSGFSHKLESANDRRIIAIIEPARRYLYLRDYLNQLGEPIKASPKDNYLWFRRLCMIGREEPWRWLPKLWRLNLRYLRRSAERGERLDSVRFLILDPILVVAIAFRLAPKHRELRLRFRQEIDLLTPRTKKWLLSE